MWSSNLESFIGKKDWGTGVEWIKEGPEIMPTALKSESLHYQEVFGGLSPYSLGAVVLYLISINSWGKEMHHYSAYQFLLNFYPLRYNVHTGKNVL